MRIDADALKIENARKTRFKYCKNMDYSIIKHCGVISAPRCRTKDTAERVTPDDIWMIGLFLI